MSGNNASSDKLLNLTLFIENHKPSLLGIIESDIHGILTPSNRKTTFSKDDILDQLHIEGYSIILPDTWNSYNQARLIIYVRDDIKIKQRRDPD